jgi:endonuclease YncB( thermonuclease family)
MGLCISKNNIDNFDNLQNLTDDIELFTLEGKTFQSKIVKVYDGDTCFAVFYLNNQPVKFKIRMYGYDSPELTIIKFCK